LVDVSRAHETNVRAVLDLADDRGAERLVWSVGVVVVVLVVLVGKFVFGGGGGGCVVLGSGIGIVVLFVKMRSRVGFISISDNGGFLGDFCRRLVPMRTI
jgi:hypothetical protein